MIRAKTDQLKHIPWFARAGAASSIVPISRFVGPSIFALKGGGYRRVSVQNGHVSIIQSSGNEIECIALFALCSPQDFELKGVFGAHHWDILTCKPVSRYI